MGAKGNKLGTIFKPTLDRLLAGSFPCESGCRLWKGATSKNGYGVLYSSEHRKSRLTHRLSYELQVGPIPDGMKVLHKCDVRRCIEPQHLFLGTTQDNQDDMARKGRSNRRLSEEAVVSIKVRIAALGPATGGARPRGSDSLRKIAADFSVDKGTVQLIAKGLTHKFVEKV